MPNKCSRCSALFVPRGTETTKRENRAYFKQNGCFISSDEKRSFADATIRAFTERNNSEDHCAGDQRYDRPRNREFTQLVIRS